MLTQVADGVWVRQSEWVRSNAVVVRAEGGYRLGLPVVAGFSTHPHWDHVLWHSRFGDVPRYAAGVPLELVAAPHPRCPRTADPCRARSSSTTRTPLATTTS
jgi:hypothetical protein